jgi:hypothetical protein
MIHSQAFAPLLLFAIRLVLTGGIIALIVAAVRRR